MADDLSMDIIVDILSRLSVKDLLRFRSVAKPWCSLIDGPEFIKKHLHNAMKTASGLGVVIGDSGLHWMSLDSPHVEKKLDNPNQEKEKPFVEVKGATEILGSCNGLLAVLNVMNDVAIWNPTTRRFRKLPDSKIDFLPEMFGSLCMVYGFGYDRVTDDYKLVRMMQCGGYDSVHSEVKVYSAKSDSWKRIRDFAYYLCYDDDEYGVLASNALHWVVSPTLRDATNIVVGFDLEKEEFLEIQMPRCMDGEIHFNVVVLEGLLCLVYNFPSDNLSADFLPQSKGVEIWVMKEYGVRDSWTKLISFVPNEQIGSFSYTLPVACLKARQSGEDRILLDKDGKKFITYDRKKGKFEDANMHSASGFVEWIVSVESLVGLDGREGHNGWEKSVESKKKEKMVIKKKKKNEKRDDFLSQGFKLVL